MRLLSMPGTPIVYFLYCIAKLACCRFPTNGKGRNTYPKDPGMCESDTLLPLQFAVTLGEVGL
jgi:hypothetical protein